LAILGVKLEIKTIKKKEADCGQIYLYFDNSGIAIFWQCHRGGKIAVGTSGFKPASGGIEQRRGGECPGVYD
jgi:hypothetical protein